MNIIYIQIIPSCLFSLSMEDFKISSLKRIVNYLFNSRNNLNIEEGCTSSNYSSPVPKFKISTVSEMKPLEEKYPSKNSSAQNSTADTSSVSSSSRPKD
jgi:hypothetical protein